MCRISGSGSRNGVGVGVIIEMNFTQIEQKGVMCLNIVAAPSFNFYLLDLDLVSDVRVSLLEVDSQIEANSK